MHARFDRLTAIHAMLFCIIAHILGDLHRAEFRSAHRAEMGHLGTIFRQRLIMVATGGIGIE